MGDCAYTLSRQIRELHSEKVSLPPSQMVSETKSRAECSIAMVAQNGLENGIIAGPRRLRSCLALRPRYLRIFFVEHDP